MGVAESWRGQRVRCQDQDQTTLLDELAHHRQ
jgi:hypothetical protein